MVLSPQISESRIDRNSPVNSSLFGDIVKNLERIPDENQLAQKENVSNGRLDFLQRLSGPLRPLDSVMSLAGISSFDAVIGNPGLGILDFDLFARNALNFRINSIDYFRNLTPIGEQRSENHGFTVENLSPDLSATSIELFDTIPISSIVDHGDYFLVNLTHGQLLEENLWKPGLAGSVSIVVGGNTTTHEIVEVNVQGRPSVLLKGEMSSQVFANEDNTAQLTHRIVNTTASAGDGFIVGDSIQSPWGAGEIIAKNHVGNNLVISEIGIAAQTFSSPSTIRSNRIRLRFSLDRDDFVAGELIDVGDSAPEILEATQGVGLVIVRPQAGNFAGGETISSRRISYGLESQVVGIEVGEKFFNSRGRGEVRQISGNDYILYYADGYRNTGTTSLLSESYLVQLNSPHELIVGDFVNVSETLTGEMELLPVTRIGISDANNVVVDFSAAIDSIDPGGKEWIPKGEVIHLAPQNNIGLLSAVYKKLGNFRRTFSLIAPKGVVVENISLKEDSGTLSFVFNDVPPRALGLELILE